MNAVAKKKVPEEKSFLGLVGGDVIRLLTTACFSFIIPMIININNKLTTIQEKQAAGEERGKAKQVAIDELKVDFRASRNETFELKLEVTTLKEQLAELSGNKIFKKY